MALRTWTPNPNYMLPDGGTNSHLDLHKIVSKAAVIDLDTLPCKRQTHYPRITVIDRPADDVVVSVVVRSLILGKPLR